MKPDSETTLHVPQWFGGGIGNEFFPYAKTLLAASHCGGSVYLPLQMDFVRRRSYFLRQSACSLPARLRLGHTVHYYTSEEYLQDVGESGAWDYSVNVRRFLARLPEGRKVVVHGGMVGGFAAIVRARAFIENYLQSYQKTGAAVAKDQSKRDPRKLTVGLHIRRGDFRNSARERVGPQRIKSKKDRLSLGRVYRKLFGFNKVNLTSGGVQGCASEECDSAWNARVPIGWFSRIVNLLCRAFPEKLQFAVVSDGLESSEKEALQIAFGDEAVTWGHKTSPHHDLLTLASCDLQICSTSSFSMWSAFLGKTPHIFYRDHLSGAESNTPYFWTRPKTSIEELALGYALGLAEESLPRGLEQMIARNLAIRVASLNSPLMGGGFRVD